MNAEEIKIIPLEVNHFESVKEIADIQFGHDYLTIDQLKACLNDSEFIGLVCQYQEKILGFSTLKVINNLNLIQIFKNQTNQIIEDLKSHEKIGYRMQTAILPMNVGSGIGSQLIKTGNQLLFEKVNIIISLVWEKSDVINIGNILSKQGFIKRHTFNKFWSKESLSNNYSCKVCGQPPCSCNAALYIKEFNYSI